ncbi:MAG: hypothetical protein NC203_11875 [Firmicutes bacterium]|nr:hypothetical protein [[Eubacterium] siraeum]MCM1489051.1 hypothetical protein [Bacillota bacterium]
MIRIAVCDDFQEAVAQMNEYLSEYQQLRDMKLDIWNLCKSRKYRIPIKQIQFSDVW